MITNSRNKLLYPIGIENTAIPRSYAENRWRASSIAVSDAEEKIDSILRRRKIAHTHCTVDGHCVEVATRKLWSMEQAENSCKKVREVFDQANCAPKNPDTVCGGAHIHVGIPDLKRRVHIFRGLLSMYYLPWIFGEADDTGSMNNVLNEKEKVTERTYFIHTNPTALSSYWGRIGVVTGLIGPENLLTKPVMSKMISGCDKETLVRLTWYTVELRFFEMAPTWEEQKLQIEFANKLIAYADRSVHNYNGWRKDILINGMKNDRDFQKITPDQALNDFKNLCASMGVDWQAYIPFINRNLYPRWSDGRRRT